jgi:hypothetical protein
MSLRAFEAIKRSHFLTAKIPLSLFPKFAQCELSGARQLRSPRRVFIFCKTTISKTHPSVGGRVLRPRSVFYFIVLRQPQNDFPNYFFNFVVG